MRIVGDDPAERAHYAAQQNKSHVGAPAIIPGTMEYGEPDFVFDEMDEEYDEARRLAERDARRAQRASQKRASEELEKPARGNKGQSRKKKTREQALPNDAFDDDAFEGQDEPSAEPEPAPAPVVSAKERKRAEAEQRKIEAKKKKERKRARSAKMVTPAQHVYQVAIAWATAAITVVATVALLFQPAQDLYRAYRENERLNDELSQNFMRNDALERRVAYLQTEQGVQDEARLTYGLIMPDENAVIVTGAAPTSGAASSWSAPAEVRRGSGQNSQSVLTDILDAVFGVNATSELASSDPLGHDLRQAVIAAYGSDINGGGSPLNDAAYIARVRPQVTRYTEQVAQSQGDAGAAAAAAAAAAGSHSESDESALEGRVEVSDVLYPTATDGADAAQEGAEATQEGADAAQEGADVAYDQGWYDESAYAEQPAYDQGGYVEAGYVEEQAYDQGGYVESGYEYVEPVYDPNADIVVEPEY